jgi:hypothetical protein
MIIVDDNVAVAVSIAAAAYAVVKATSRKRTAAPWTRVKIQLFASFVACQAFFFASCAISRARGCLLAYMQSFLRLGRQATVFWASCS